jgi:molybdate transport system substrate-binding protein
MKIFLLLMGMASQVSASSITVLAASSLTDVLPRVAQQWKEQGGDEVIFSFEASSRLARQIENGVPADLFASADHEWMDYLQEKGRLLSDSRRVLAGNALILIVPAGSSIRSLADLRNPTVKTLALAGENVPVARYAKVALQSAGLWEKTRAKIVRADNARTVLRWVAEGHADAGVVYRTDALGEARVKVVLEFPEWIHPSISYPVAVLKQSSVPARALAFLKFCIGPEARKTWKKAGFVLPAVMP